MIDMFFMAIAFMIVTAPIFIVLTIILYFLRKEVIKEMHNGKTFWKALKEIFCIKEGYYNAYDNKLYHNEPFSSIGWNINDYPNPNYSSYSNQSNVNTGANFITDPKYCSIPGNLLYNSSITGKY